MSRYLILLPAPEAEWADLPPEAHEKGSASHGQFHAGPRGRGPHPRDGQPARAVGAGDVDATRRRRAARW